MTEQGKPDLRSIEPIGRAPDADDEGAAERESTPVGQLGAAVTNTPAAVGVEADTVERQRDAEPRTSPETEEQPDQLRRG